MARLYARTLVSIALCWCASHAFAQKEDVAKLAPDVNPPQILAASSIAPDGQLVLVSYHSIHIGFDGYSYNERVTKKVSIKDALIRTVDGRSVSLTGARNQIAAGDTPILVTSYNASLPSFYSAMFQPDTLLFAFPSKAPTWKQIESPGGSSRK